MSTCVLLSPIQQIRVVDARLVHPFNLSSATCTSSVHRGAFSLTAAID